MNFDLQTVCNFIILISATVVAITNIYKFFANSKKGIEKTVDRVKEEQEKEFNDKVDVRVKETVQPMLDAQARTLTASFEGLLDKHLPPRLYQHDLEIRDKYLADRQRYLCEITEEVIDTVQGKIDAVEVHEGQMVVFSEVLKELLRERIMEIYRRNKHKCELEDHERYELK